MNTCTNPNCAQHGRPIPAYVRFCPTCGSSVQTKTPAARQWPRRVAQVIVAVLGVAILLVVASGIGSWMAFRSMNEPAEVAVPEPIAGETTPEIVPEPADALSSTPTEPPPDVPTATATEPPPDVPTSTPTDVPTSTPTVPPPATSTPIPPYPIHRVAYLAEGALSMWLPATGETIQISDGPAIKEYFWAPDGQHIAYTELNLDNSDTALYVADLVGNVFEIGSTINSSFAWSPDGTELVYADLECKLHLVRPNGSNDYVLADLSTEAFPGGGGGGPQGEMDWIDDFIQSSHFSPSDIRWSRDNSQIAAILPPFRCISAIVDQNGGVTQCHKEECWPQLGQTTDDLLVGPQNNPNIFLQDNPEALWHYTYQGIALDQTTEGNTNWDFVLDVSYRSTLANWGFHNNFMRTTAESTQLLTDKPTFKWQAMWSPNQVWIVFTELVVTEGRYEQGHGFSGDRVTDIWALHVESGELIQITNVGNALLPLWQPVATRP